jgi:hypothetical protein
MPLEAKRIRMNTSSLAPVPEYRLMRSTNRIYSALTVTVLFASLALQASAATVFFDDFSDGDAQDGMPVTWTEAIGGDYDATSGDYVLTATPGGGVMLSTVVDITLTDFSIRTQVRTSSELGTVFVAARVQEPLEVSRFGSYFGALDYNPNFGGTRLLLGRADADSPLTYFGDLTVLPFDVRIDDAVLQLDVIGNQLKLWVWKAGDPMPDQPQLTATDNTYSEGAMRIVNDKENLNIGTFRYVHVADSHIPEPSTLLLAMLGMAGTCCYRRRC